MLVIFNKFRIVYKRCNVYHESKCPRLRFDIRSLVGKKVMSDSSKLPTYVDFFLFSLFNKCPFYRYLPCEARNDMSVWIFILDFIQITKCWCQIIASIVLFQINIWLVAIFMNLKTRLKIYLKHFLRFLSHILSYDILNQLISRNVRTTKKSCGEHYN